MSSLTPVWNSAIAFLAMSNRACTLTCSAASSRFRASTLACSAASVAFVAARSALARRSLSARSASACWASRAAASARVARTGGVSDRNRTSACLRMST
jgi:hypothetical protein